MLDTPENPTISFLSRLFSSKTNDAAGARVCLGAFGKHPGWNDHIDDQGLETQLLVDFKTLLYVEAMVAAIDSGKWDALDAAGQGVPFGHAFLMRSRGDTLVGLLWASTDGKGRSKYPMVVVAECSGTGVEWAVERAMPVLERVKRACQEATTSQAVIAILDQARAELREAAAEIAADPPEITLPAGIAAAIADRPELGPARQGLHRVLYQIEREMTDYLRGRVPSSKIWKPEAPIVRGHHLRVPAVGGSNGVGSGMLDWTRLLLAKIEPWTPMLVLAPLEYPWVDIIVGEPNGAMLMCIRSSERAVPPASAVPYTLDSAFLESVERWLAESKSSGPRSIQGSETRFRRGGAGGGAGAGRFLSPLCAVGVVAMTLLGLGGPIDARAQTPPQTASHIAATPAVSAALESARTTWLAELERRHGAGTPEYQAAARDVDAILASVERRVPASIERPGLSDTPWIAALDAEARARRERAFRRLTDGWAASPGVPDFTDPAVQGSVADAANEQAVWLGRVAALARDLQRMQALLDTARSFTEVVDGVSLEQLSARWQADPIMKDAAVRAAAAPMIDRADALAVIETQVDARALVEQVMQGRPDRPEAVLGAWRRLGSVRATPVAPLWPVSVQDVETELSLRDPLNRVTATIPVAARRGVLEEEIRTEQSRRFMRFVGRADDADAVAAALRLAPSFGVSPDQLDPRFRFNLALIELKKSVSGADGAAAQVSDAAARAAVVSFIERVEALPGGVAFLGEAQAVIAPLRELLSGRSPSAMESDVTLLGPGATGSWVGAVDGDFVRFKAAQEKAVPTLEFVRVTPPSGGPAYLATTELSVAQAAAIASALGAPAEVAKVLPRFDPREDPRQGPRSWQWGGVAAKQIVPPREWLARATLEAAASDYPPGQAPPAPGWSDPIQQVSPSAAVYLAAMAGCRLPTVAEWGSARAQYAPEVTFEQSNLRDRRWRVQQEFVDGLIALGRPAQAADAGSFVPHGLRMEGARAARSHPWDDGVLWFAPVDKGSAGRVHHLVGNVAEWVFDDAVAGSGEFKDAAAAQALIERNARHVRVIGGSALSEPAIDPLIAARVDFDEAQEGYSDVGLRLAFSAGPETQPLSFAAKLHRALTPLRVLPPK